MAGSKAALLARWPATKKLCAACRITIVDWCWFVGGQHETKIAVSSKGEARTDILRQEHSEQGLRREHSLLSHCDIEYVYGGGATSEGHGSLRGEGEEVR